jgi:heme/copper-type cytochrome/quinol oxidase subunit 2
MFDNEHLTYICGHYKRRASKTYDSRQHPRERSKTEILTTINPLLLFFFIPCGTFRSYRKISRNTVYKNGRLKYQQF